MVIGSSSWIRTSALRYEYGSVLLFMGHRLTCCRQTWVELYDGGLEDWKNSPPSGHCCYQNNGADFSEEDSGLKIKSHVTLASFTPINLHNEPVVTHSTTQHISEREPEDIEYDPSLNASQHTLFFSGITPKSQDFSRSLTTKAAKKISGNCGTKRWSSCSTVFVGDGCLARPDVNDMLWSASVAIRLLMSSDLNRYFSKQLHKSDASHTADHLCSEYFQDMYEDVYKTFDERIYPIEHSVCDENYKTSATGDCEYTDARTIQQFLRSLFSTAILGPECAIVALIFLERLIVGAEVAMISWTWRRQLLACVLLASKVLDDQAVWNIDYCQILRDTHVEDLNALERHTLRLLQFNINVPFGVYARYYFDLLTVGETAGVANQIIKRKRLTPERARNFRILPINPEISALDKTAFDKGFLFDLPSSVKLEALNNEITNRKSSIVTKSTMRKGNKGNTQKQFNKTPFVIRNQSTTDSEQYIENCDLISIHKSLPADVTNYQSSNDFNSINDSLGPIQLDDETEFVNSTLPPFFNINNPTSQSKQIKLKCANRTQKISYQSHRQFPMNYQKMSIHYRKYQSNSLGEPSDRPNCAEDCNAPCPSLSSTGGVDSVNDSRTGTEFIRSLMGGDAAYSLLRDSGLY